MKTYLQIQTPTKIDLREIFTMGLTTKADGTKIGHKGSGLKFTLALLHRLGSCLHLWTPDGSYTSKIHVEPVRGVDQRFIQLASGRTKVETHICENAGADTWTEPWFALRELLQNAIDEGGTYGTFEATDKAGTELPEGDFTIMRVELTDPLQQAWDRRDEWFHPRHPEIIYESQYPGLYFHGFQIYKAPDWLWAYDVTGILRREKLSEDRQARNVDWYNLFKEIVVRGGVLPSSFYDEIVKKRDQNQIAPTDLHQLVQAVYYETNASQRDVGTFEMAKLEAKVAALAGEGNRPCYTTNANPEAPMTAYARQAGFTPVVVPNDIARILNYSEIPQADSCVPSLEKRLKPRIFMDFDQAMKFKEAQRIAKKVRPEGTKVEVVTVDNNEDRQKLNFGAVVDFEQRKVLIHDEFVATQPIEKIVRALAVNFVALQCGRAPTGEGLEEALAIELTNQLMPKQRKLVAA